MAYGTLLLHLDAHPHLDARIDMAIHLACRFESHLIGLAASGSRVFASSPVAGFLKPEQVAGATASARGHAEELARRFAGRARMSGVRSFEARVDDDEDAPALVRNGLCCDLAVLGQPDPDFLGHSVRRAQFEQALMHGASPALVVPFLPQHVEVGTRVVLGWNDSRECARAVAAAIPLLRKAAEVHVVQFTPSLDGATAHVPCQVDRVRDWLAHNDVKAEAWVRTSDRDAGASLLAEAAQRSADLIVMGAWGHARWAERVFGGSTHTVLAHSNVPVLVAR